VSPPTPALSALSVCAATAAASSSEPLFSFIKDEAPEHGGALTEGNGGEEILDASLVLTTTRNTQPSLTDLAVRAAHSKHESDTAAELTLRLPRDQVRSHMASAAATAQQESKRAPASPARPRSQSHHLLLPLPTSATTNYSMPSNASLPDPLDYAASMQSMSVQSRGRSVSMPAHDTIAHPRAIMQGYHSGPNYGYGAHNHAFLANHASAPTPSQLSVSENSAFSAPQRSLHSRTQPAYTTDAVAQARTMPATNTAAPGQVPGFHALPWAATPELYAIPIQFQYPTYPSPMYSPFGAAFGAVITQPPVFSNPEEG
jgi:hypothetical protein